MMTESTTNQIFPIVPNELLPHLDELCTYEVWGKADKGHTVVRFVTSFASTVKSVDGFLKELKDRT